MKKKSSVELEDDLRPEYDFHKLRVVARGPGRKKPAETTIQLEADVAEVFPRRPKPLFGKWTEQSL